MLFLEPKLCPGWGLGVFPAYGQVRTGRPFGRLSHAAVSKPGGLTTTAWAYGAVPVILTYSVIGGCKH